MIAANFSHRATERSIPNRPHDANEFDAIAFRERLVRPFAPMKCETVVLDQHRVRWQIVMRDQFGHIRCATVSVFSPFNEISCCDQAWSQSFQTGSYPPRRRSFCNLGRRTFVADFKLSRRHLIHAVLKFWRDDPTTHSKMKFAAPWPV